MTKNERRAAARQKAQKLRELQKKKERRNRWFMQGGILVGILVAVGIITLVVVSSVRPPGIGPRNMISDGITIGPGGKPVLTEPLASGAFPTAYYESDENGRVNIRVYQDYLCPHCKNFEMANHAYIDSLLKSGGATYSVHPIAILSAANRYSSRAANAAACVASYVPDDFMKFNLSLYENQPSETSAGPGNDFFWNMLQSAGVTDTQVKKCIDDGQYRNWVSLATERVRRYVLPNSDHVSLQGTPTILVNGRLYPGDPADSEAFKNFVVASQGITFSVKPTEQPTPGGAGASGSATSSSSASAS